MKYTLATVFALAGVAAAQLNAIPSCALPCITKAVEANGCAASDFACACSKLDTIQGQASPCVLGACDGSEISETLSAVKELCNNLPPPSSSAPAKPTSSSPSYESSAASYPASSPSSAGYPTASSTEVGKYPTGTPSETPSYPASTVTTSYLGTGTGVPTKTAATSQVVVTAGAAVAGPVGGVAAFALAALVAF